MTTVVDEKGGRDQKGQNLCRRNIWTASYVRYRDYNFNFFLFRFSFEQAKKAEILDCVVQKLYKRYDPDNENAKSTKMGTPTDQANGRKCHKVLIKCSYLDPRFKSFLKDEDISEAKKLLIEENRSAAESDSKYFVVHLLSVLHHGSYRPARLYTRGGYNCGKLYNHKEGVSLYIFNSEKK